MKTWQIIGVAILSFAATSLYGEILVTNDGSQIRGELVGYEDGCYVVQIGRFQKKIPEGDVKDIRESAPADSHPSSSSFSSSPSLSPTTNPYSSPRRGGRRRNAPGNLDPAAFQRMLEAAGMGGRGRQGRSRPGGRLPVSADTESLLKQAVDMQKNDPTVRRLSGKGNLDGKVADLLRGGGNPQDLEGLRDNPSMGVMVDRFRNKDFQNRLLDELRNMNQDLNPDQPNPNMEMLEQLFQQLNSAGDGE